MHVASYAGLRASERYVPGHKENWSALWSVPAKKMGVFGIALACIGYSVDFWDALPMCVCVSVCTFAGIVLIGIYAGSPGAPCVCTEGGCMSVTVSFWMERHTRVW